MKRREEKLEEKNLINKSNKPKKGLQNQVLKKQFQADQMMNKHNKKNDILKIFLSYKNGNN